MNQENRIIVTHCVDPHKFYFKYMNDCVNGEYSNFDYTVQCYGNRLHSSKQDCAYSPNKNEIIIFFDLILNKWLRGRVTNVDDDEISLWCIDNGVNRKSSKEFVQPLTENLQRDFNLVHIGGLSVLPAESKLNFDTLNVEKQVEHYWDDGIKNNFKTIIDSAKRITFIEEMVLKKHKFGSLFTESKNDKVVVFNEILIQLGKAISCGAEEMSSYFSEKRLKHELCQLYEKRSSTKLTKFEKTSQIEVHSKAFKSKTNESCASGIEEHTRPDKSEKLSKTSTKSVIEVDTKVAESKLFSNTSDISGRDVQFNRKNASASGKCQIEVHSKAFESKTATNGSCESKMEEQLQPDESERLSKASIRSEIKDHPKDVESKASGKSRMNADPLIRNTTSNASGKTQIEVHSKAFESKTSSNETCASGIEEHIQPDKSEGLSKASIKSEIEVDAKVAESKTASNASDKSGRGVQFNCKNESVIGEGQKEVNSKAFESKTASNESSKSKVEEQLEPNESDSLSKASIKSEIKVHSKDVESKAISNASGKFGMDVNPFIPKKTSNSSCKTQIEVHSEAIESKTASKESGEYKMEEQLQPEESEGLSKASIKSELEVQSSVQSKPFVNASGKSGMDVEPKSTSTASDKLGMNLLINPFIRKKPFKTSSKTQLEVLSKAVEAEPFSNASGKTGIDVNPFIRKKTSTSSGKTQIEVHSKAFESKTVSTASGKPEMNILSNPLIPKKTSNVGKSEPTPYSKTNGLELTKRQPNQAVQKDEELYGKNNITIDNLSNISKKNDVSILSSDESFDNSGTTTVVDSSLKPEPHKNGKSNLKRSRAIDQGKILKQPTQSSMDWIAEMSRELCQLYEKRSSSKFVQRKKTSNSSSKSIIELHSKEFESNTAFNDSFESKKEEHLQLDESERLSNTSIQSEVEMDSKPVESKPFIKATGTSGDFEFNPFIRKKTSNETKLYSKTECKNGSQLTKRQSNQAVQKDEELNVENNLGNFSETIEDPVWRRMIHH